MSASVHDPGSIDVGPLTPGDAPACQAIFDAAYLDLHRRHGLEVDDPSDENWLAPILGHFLETDPAGSVIARHEEGAAAFACSFRRDDFWFLSFLFVMPRWQRQGVGRRLLERLLPGDGTVQATVVESFQAVSTGLYASEGMAPRSLKYWVSDFARPELLPHLPEDVVRTESTATDLAEIDALDRGILGFARPADHAWWRDAGQQRFSFRRGDDLVAYAYVDDGFVGPALATDQHTLSVAVSDVIRASDDPKRMSVNLSGESDRLFRVLMEAGGRIDDQEPYRFVYCSTAGPLSPSYVHHSDWLP